MWSNVNWNQRYMWGSDFSKKKTFGRTAKQTDGQPKTIGRNIAKIENFEKNWKFQIKKKNFHFNFKTKIILSKYLFNFIKQDKNWII